MKNLIFVISLTPFFCQGLLAFDPETPTEVANFVLISKAKEAIEALMESHPQYRGQTFEQLAPSNQDELLKTVVQTPALPPLLLKEMKEKLESLPGLIEKMISNEKLRSFIPYGSRKYLPEEFRGSIFEVIKEFNFAGDGKILAIGGTDKEIELLSTAPFNLVKENICAINVLPYENPHYVADMTQVDQMEMFKDKFDYALLSAVPIDSNNLNNTLINIASSLKNDGIIVAHSSDFGSDENVEQLLLSHGFSSAKILVCKENSCWFIASKLAKENLEEVVRSNPITKALLDYIMRTLAFQQND